MRHVLRATLVALLIAVTAGCGGRTVHARFFGSVVPERPFEVSGTQLRTATGAPLSLRTDLTKPLTLVFFGFVHCPDICPMVLTSLASAMLRLSEAERQKIAVLFVTTDPTRDTGAVMTRYLSRIDPRFRGVRGEIAAVADVARSVGIYVDAGNRLASGGYDPGLHSTYVVAVEPDGEAPVFWHADTSPSEYAHDLRYMLGGGRSIRVPREPLH